MPHSITPRQSKLYAEPHRRSMSSQVAPSKREIPNLSAGFSLFPKDGERLDFLGGDDPFNLSLDMKEPVRDNSTFDDLLVARSESTPEIGYGGTRRDRGQVNGHVNGYGHGRALSPTMDSSKRANFLGDAFAFRDNNHVGSVRQRIQNDSPVIAELRTNVIVKDEFTLVTDMSYHLSTRFSRPESAIMINVDHSACLLLAGSFEPAYMLTISALPSQLQPSTNKRNAALIQSFMADILSVPPERGIVRFLVIPEENLATNGATIFGEIERVEKQQSEDNAVVNGTKTAWTSRSRRSLTSPTPGANPQKQEPSKSQQQQQPRKPALKHSPSIPEPLLNLPGSKNEKSILKNGSTASLVTPPLPSQPSPTPPGVYELPADERRRSATIHRVDSKTRNSGSTLKNVVSNDRKRSNTFTSLPKAPPVPEDAKSVKSQRLGKRRSFMSVFRTKQAV